MIGHTVDTDDTPRAYHKVLLRSRTCGWPTSPIRVYCQTMVRRQLLCPIVGAGISLTKVGLEAGFYEHSLGVSDRLLPFWHRSFLNISSTDILESSHGQSLRSH